MSVWDGSPRLLARLRWLFPLSLRENLVQPLSFDCQTRPGGLGQLLREFEQVLSHDYKNTPTGTILKSFGAGKISNLQIRKSISATFLRAAAFRSRIRRKEWCPRLRR